MSSKKRARSSNSITLDAIDNDGNQRKAILKATAIGGDVDGPVSNADDIDPFRRKSFDKHGLIHPPLSLHKLDSLKEESDSLGQNIRAMVTNTVGFGWMLKERAMPDELRSSLENEIALERARLKSLLETVHPTESFTLLLEKIKEDQHSNGNGYMELITAGNGQLVGVNHVLGHMVRLTEKDKQPTKVMVPRVNPERNFEIDFVPMWYRFRKFLMLRFNKKVWFKEAGDPRLLNKHTGEFSPDVQLKSRATALLHFKVYSPTTPYGQPLWVGNLFSVFGSRKAEEINFGTLSSNAIPSCFVIVENGALTESSIERLREWTEEQIQKSVNRSKFLLLEGVLEEGAPNPTNFKIRVEPLKQLQQDDQLFQDYSKNNRETIRQSFRLPGLFVGRVDDLNRATADISKTMADEQVFNPERSRDAFAINRFMLMPWNARFHTFRLNHPNVTDDIELIRLMAISERSGAMTPRRADRIIRDVFGDDIGPMPKGIDLDKPFSITFAEAQKMGGMSPAEGTAGRVVSDLVSLRKQLEEELDIRMEDEIWEDTHAEE